MNLIEHVVEEVLGAPHEKYGKWFVSVISNSWGHKDYSNVMVNTKEEAEAIKPGYTYEA